MEKLLQIRYLNREEKEETRQLYHTCFPEDSDSFVNYYYECKCSDNRVLSGYLDTRLCTMVHENPFRISLCGNQAEVSYIVAVATDPEVRGRGFMRSVLGSSLRNASRRGEPFSFLIPANPAYYESLGYRFWTQTIWKRRDWNENFLSSFQSVGGLSEEELDGFAKATNEFLKDHFDLYVERDAMFYRRLVLEQRSEFGDVCYRKTAQTDGNCAMESFRWDREEGFELLEPISNQVEEDREQIMMGRILNLKRFISMLCSTEPLDETFRICDPLIKENDGCFHIRINENGGFIEPDSDQEDLNTIDIARLGELLFGRLRIFINEIV